MPSLLDKSFFYGSRPSSCLHDGLEPGADGADGLLPHVLQPVRHPPVLPHPPPQDPPQGGQHLRGEGRQVQVRLLHHPKYRNTVSLSISICSYSIHVFPTHEWSPLLSANHGPSCLTSVFLGELVFPAWYSIHCLFKKSSTVQCSRKADTVPVRSQVNKSLPTVARLIRKLLEMMFVRWFSIFYLLMSFILVPGFVYGVSIGGQNFFRII